MIEQYQHYSYEYHIHQPSTHYEMDAKSNGRRTSLIFAHRRTLRYYAFNTPCYSTRESKKNKPSMFRRLFHETLINTRSTYKIWADKGEGSAVSPLKRIIYSMRLKLDGLTDCFVC